MRRLIFEEVAFEQFTNWASVHKKIFDRIVKLLEETKRTPFEGTGKPEALKYELKGYWSRRINEEHRLVYKVTDDSIIVIACKNHY